MAFLQKTGQIINNNIVLRLAFYAFVLLALIVVHLYTGGETISFVYNEF